MAEYLSPAVFIEEQSSGIKPIQGVGTSVGGFVGHAERGPLAVATAVNSYGEFERIFGRPIDNGYLAFAVKAFFDEGGSSCWIVRTSHYTAPTAPAAVASGSTFQNPDPINALRVAASSPGAWGNTLTVTIALVAPDLFTITVFQSGAQVERLLNLSMDPLSLRYAPVIVEQLSTFIRVTDMIPSGSALTAAARRPQPAATPVALTGGVDGLTSLATSDYIGDAAASTGLHALDTIDEVNIIAIPDAVDRQVHVLGMAYCEARMDCFYVADPPEMATTALEVLNYKQAQGAYAGGNAFNSKYGALYTPWIDVIDPRDGGVIRIPPSGAVIGRYARTDELRGVHKAPAGVVDGRMASVVGLAAAFSHPDQEMLNPRGINVIRRFPGVGNVIWGARTVSSDPEWRLLNVRRLFLFLEESIEESTLWTVFEPNDPFLWKSIERNVSAFLRLQWLAGALVGVTEEEAFYVKCDAETNPIESVRIGRVITEIGVAPSKPAEFVIFRIEQFEGGSDVSE
ncbi:MAG: phage tail sheath family protein [Acidobacteria bacterium]|nr:phage tail sheath family protein [Acidobacteriota bacterium]